MPRSLHFCFSFTCYFVALCLTLPLFTWLLYVKIFWHEASLRLSLSSHISGTLLSGSLSSSATLYIAILCELCMVWDIFAPHLGSHISLVTLFCGPFPISLTIHKLFMSVSNGIGYISFCLLLGGCINLMQHSSALLLTLPLFTWSFTVNTSWHQVSLLLYHLLVVTTCCFISAHMHSCYLCALITHADCHKFNYCFSFHLLFAYQHSLFAVHCSHLIAIVHQHSMHSFNALFLHLCTFCSLHTPCLVHAHSAMHPYCPMHTRCLLTTLCAFLIHSTLVTSSSPVASASWWLHAHSSIWAHSFR